MLRIRTNSGKQIHYYERFISSKMKLEYKTIVMDKAEEMLFLVHNTIAPFKRWDICPFLRWIT